MKISILVSIFFSSSCFAQTYNTIEKDSDILEFIEWKLNLDSSKNMNVAKEYFLFSQKILSWEPENLGQESTTSKIPDGFGSIYDRGRKFVKAEISPDDSLHFISVSQAYLTNTWLFSKKETGREIKDHFLYISLPLFTLDKRYAIIKELYYCGEDCGEMKIILYKKTNRGWSYHKYIIGGII